MCGKRQHRLRHCTTANPPLHGRSRGRVSAQSFPEVDIDRHTGQRAASGSLVTSCTIFTPEHDEHSRSTAKPSRPNKHDASSLPSPRPAALLSLLQDTAGIKELRATLVQARRTGPTSGWPVKIDEPYNDHRENTDDCRSRVDVM